MKVHLTGGIRFLKKKRSHNENYYYGHSCFAAEIKGKHLLFDPFIAENPLAKTVDIKKLNADYIFVSHAHFDHIADGVTIANQTGATVISNYEIITWLGKKG